MKLKITLAKMASPGFIGGFRRLRKSRFGRAEAWALYRTGEQIDRELERYLAIREEIEDRFAQSDGKVKFIPKESVAEFQHEVEELGKKEVELWLDHQITLPEDCQIEPDEIGALVEAGVVAPPDIPPSEPSIDSAQVSLPFAQPQGFQGKDPGKGEQPQSS